MNTSSMIDKGNFSDWDHAKRIIKSIVSPPSIPLTIGMIKQEIKEKTSIEYSSSVLSNFIKHELCYSYKRGWSRPQKYKTEEMKTSKALFWTELINMMDTQHTIISIDESSLDRHTRKDYSWLPIGCSSSILNQDYRGKASLVIGMLNKGSWFAYVKTGTMNSTDFWVFMKLTDKAFSIKRRNNAEQLVAIIDNAPTHCSKFTKKTIQDLNIEVKFFPPYCPEVAPVEQIFRAVKSKFKSMFPSWRINFESEVGVKKILKWVDLLQFSSWLKPWLSVSKECRRTIVGLCKRIKQNVQEEERFVG